MTKDLLTINVCEIINSIEIRTTFIIERNVWNKMTNDEKDKKRLDIALEEFDIRSHHYRLQLIFLGFFVVRSVPVNYYGGSLDQLVWRDLKYRMKLTVKKYFRFLCSFRLVKE